MRRSRGAVIAAVGIGALALAGAAASTDSLSFTNSNTTVAYGSEVVTGATVSSITYSLSADGSTIQGVTFVASGNTSGSTGQVGFSTSAGTQPLYACEAGVYSSGPGTTSYTCTGTESDPMSQAVYTVTATDIVVS